MIRKLFHMGDYGPAHQGSSVQSKESVIKAVLQFREIVLGDPFLAGCVHQKNNFEFT